MVRFLLSQKYGKKRRVFQWLFISSFVFIQAANGQTTSSRNGDEGKDTSINKSFIKKLNTDILPFADTLPLHSVQNLPYTYTGQYLDGRVTGLKILRTSGEPGVAPLSLIRGLSVPLGNNKDIYDNQPLYVVNGIPLIRNDHPYQMAIKDYDFTGIGSGIDITSLVDMNNVEKVQILKGADAVARYGLLAANGAIVINTRTPHAGKYQIGLNLYGGVALRPSLNTNNSPFTINGAYERAFQLPFYQKYGSNANRMNFPSYLADSTGTTYFGSSNWEDLYYRNAIQNGIGVNISAGNERANFRFGIGEHTENGVVDKTSLKRYNVNYDMNLVPLTNLDIRVFVQAATANRNRNNSLRERFAEMEYFPNQEYPLSPNKDHLSQYYSYVDDGIDQNQVNSIQGLVNLKYEVLKNLSVNSRFSVDYNDNHRDYFVPGSLNDGNSFNSYFTGVNQRIFWNNYASFNKSLSPHSLLELNVGQSLQFDRMQYSYIKGYRGPSDFIKIIQVDNGNNVLVTHDKSLVYAYKDYLKQNVVSFYGHAKLNLNNKYAATFSLRSDGSSYFGNGYHWFVSPSLNLEWNVKEETWFKNSRLFNEFKMNVSGGRMARQPLGDYYGYGPYYTVDIGWPGSQNISTYSSFPTLSLPFTSGYVGGGIKSPYTEHLDLGIEATVGRSWNVSVDLYSKTNRDLLISVPTGAASYGFSGEWKNGMDVRSTGVEFTLGKEFELNPRLKWHSGIIFQYNQSKLLHLPDGIQAINYGNRRLNVGKDVDQFWILQNEGIYESESEIPISSNGSKLSYNGVPFNAGDPKWKDVNKDGIIDDNDRVMQGHILAPIHGGWNNAFNYKSWTLNFSLVYSMGNSILNRAVSNRFDFINREGVNGLDGIKEITFWQVKGNLDKYPRYNPWSLVNPYQTDQTLFYEKAGFVQLKSVSFQHDLTKLPIIKKSGINKLQAYLTGTNLFMLTPYSGNNPSLVDYFGYDNGYAHPMPVTFTLGLNANF